MLWQDIEIGYKVKTDTKKITKEEIITFAKEFDPQPMHLDEEAAKGTLFGQLVASGWQTSAITMRLIVDSNPLGDIPLIGVRLSDVALTGPVLPDDVLHATAEVISKRESNSKPGLGYVEVRVETFANDKQIAGQTWQTLVPIKS